jgi:hypothetical protein
MRLVVLPQRANERIETFTRFAKSYDPFISAKEPALEHDLFISYCHIDKAFVERVHDHLENTFGDGIRIFRDEAGGLNPGNIIPDKLKYAIRASRCMAAFYSGSYVRSGACNMEFRLGLMRLKRLPKQFQLRPILIGSAHEITGAFADVKWQDAAGSVENACSLAKSIVSSVLEARRAPANSAI